MRVHAMDGFTAFDCLALNGISLSASVLHQQERFIREARWTDGAICCSDMATAHQAS